MSQYRNVPVEQETKVQGRREVSVGEFKALHENWFYEGIIAESLIFDEAEVGQMSDEELEKLVLNSSFIGDDTTTTITRNRNGFAFVNFNFVTA